jgi:hypothetical protein
MFPDADIHWANLAAWISKLEALEHGVPTAFTFEGHLRLDHIRVTRLGSTFHYQWIDKFARSLHPTEIDEDAGGFICTVWRDEGHEGYLELDAESAAILINAVEMVAVDHLMYARLREEIQQGRIKGKASIPEASRPDDPLLVAHGSDIDPVLTGWLDAEGYELAAAPPQPPSWSPPLGVEIHGPIPLRGRLEFQVDGRAVVGRIIGRNTLDIAVQLDVPPTILHERPIQTFAPGGTVSRKERGDWTAVCLMAELARAEWNHESVSTPPSDSPLDAGDDKAGNPEPEDPLGPEGQYFVWIDDELKAKLEGFPED